jgi:hypothetical protein
MRRRRRRDSIDKKILFLAIYTTNLYLPFQDTLFSTTTFRTNARTTFDSTPTAVYSLKQVRSIALIHQLTCNEPVSLANINLATRTLISAQNFNINLIQSSSLMITFSHQLSPGDYLLSCRLVCRPSPTDYKSSSFIYHSMLFDLAPNAYYCFICTGLAHPLLNKLQRVGCVRKPADLSASCFLHSMSRLSKSKSSQPFVPSLRISSLVSSLPPFHHPNIHTPERLPPRVILLSFTRRA